MSPVKNYRQPVLLLILIAASEAWAAPQLQNVTLRFYPQTMSGGCAQVSADGGTTTNYAASANETFTFADPLPPDAALSHLVVMPSILGSCPASHDVEAVLNPTRTEIYPNYLYLQPIVRAAATASCAQPATFAKASTRTKYISGYRRGGQNALLLTEVPQNGSTCSVLLEYVDVTFYYWTAVPTVQFDVAKNCTNELGNCNPEQRRVLLHKYRTDGTYPSSFQRDIPYDYARDGNVLIKGTVTNADGTPYANESIYLRQYDPADPSSYIPAGARHDWDNGNNTGSFSDDGAINLPAYDPLGLTPWYIDQTDSEGRFVTILRKADYFAGDNVAVEASAVPLALPKGLGTGECTEADRCYRGGTFTWWKRMYLEVDNMFRSGAFLTRDVVPGATEIEVTNSDPWRNASATNSVPITFIHGNHGGAAGYGWSENHRVVRVRGRRLTLDGPVIRDYTAYLSFEVPTQYAGDAVGRTDLGTFPVTVDLATTLQRSAFVEYVLLPNTNPIVPFVDACQNSYRYCAELAWRWIENQASGHTVANHQHLIAAQYSPVTNEIGSTMIGQFGGYPTASFVLTGRIEQIVATQPGYGGLNVPNMIAETAAHEIVHLYDVNPPALESDNPAVTPTGGHCTALAFDVGNCLMSTAKQTPEYADARVTLDNKAGYVNCGGFCADRWDLWGASEYRRIRYQKEPLPEVMQKNRNAD